MEPYQNRLLEYHMSDDVTDKAEFAYEDEYTGNIVSKDVYENGELVPAQSVAYTYRNDGILASVKVGDNPTVSYSYDAFGQRTEMFVGATPLCFDYDGGSLLTERTWDGELDRSYLPGVSTTDEWDAITQYYHADAHGSNTMLIDENGDPSARETYDAWGNTVSLSSVGTGRFGYGGDYGYKSDDGVAGSWQDAPVTGGIIQCGVRYYDPDLGRFLQQDSVLGFPHLSGSLNRYVYCGNDPVNAIDPTGELWVLAPIVVGVILVVMVVAILALYLQPTIAVHCAMRGHGTGSGHVGGGGHAHDPNEPIGMPPCVPPGTSRGGLLPIPIVPIQPPVRPYVNPPLQGGVSLQSGGWAMPQRMPIPCEGFSAIKYRYSLNDYDPATKLPAKQNK